MSREKLDQRKEGKNGLVVNKFVDRMENSE